MQTFKIATESNSGNSLEIKKTYFTDEFHYIKAWYKGLHKQASNIK